MANDAGMTLNIGAHSSPARPKRGRPPKNESPILPGGVKKPYACTYCERSFGRKSDMARHLHVHTGTKPHRCDFEGCGKQFIQTSALTVHKRVHTGEKPHSCPEDACDKKFSDSSSLARHRKIHKKPYQCGFGLCSKGTMSWDKLQDHATRTHKGVAYAGQDLRALQGYSDLFGYKKSQDGRIFAIPLRVVQPNLYTLQLVEDMEKCQEYTPGPEDLWLIKENPNIPFPLAYTQIRAVFDAPAPVQAQALAQTAYQNSATYSMVSAPAGAPQMSSEWRQATGIGASSTPDQMQVPGLATTADSTALPPAVNYMMTSYNTASPYAQLPQHPDISAYIERPDGGRMAPHSTVPISANIGPSLELPPSQVMPMQQQLPMANFASMAYNYCQPGQFQPILEEQTGHAEFHDHRRSSGSSAGTYYSEGDDVSGMDFESSAHNQSYAGPAHQYASNMPACVQPSEPYEDFERSTGDGSHSPVPDLTSSEAQSPAEEDADNMTLEGDDMAIKLEIDHTNGQLLPSQVHNIY